MTYNDITVSNTTLFLCVSVFFSVFIGFFVINKITALINRT